MLSAAAETPRKILPPPTTIPTCTPVLFTSAISRASSFTRSAWIPNDAPPASASPLSFSRTRLYLGTGFGGSVAGGVGSGRVAHLESREAGNGDVFTQLGDLRL